MYACTLEGTFISGPSMSHLQGPVDVPCVYDLRSVSIEPKRMKTYS